MPFILDPELEQGVWINAPKPAPTQDVIVTKCDGRGCDRSRYGPELGWSCVGVLDYCPSCSG